MIYSEKKNQSRYKGFPHWASQHYYQEQGPYEYKESWWDTILIKIGDSFIKRALFDLGTSVNLLSYSIYK